MKVKKITHLFKSLIAVALLVAFSQNVAALELVLEAEGYTESYNGGNISIGTPATYSGGAYTIVEGEDGEPAVPFEVEAGGNYTITLYYYGGSNTYYNLYDSDASSKLSDGKIDDLGSMGIFEFGYELEAGKTYYIGLYGNTGTVFDYATVSDADGTLIKTLEAEDFTAGYNTGNVAIATPEAFSGDSYTLITGEDGEPKLEFQVEEAGEYSFELFYYGGSNTYYNLYDSDAETKLSDGKIDDLGSMGKFEFTYELEAGKTYYVGLYGNTGTIFDYAVIKGGTPTGINDAQAEENSISFDGNNIILDIEGAYDYIVSDLSGRLIMKGQASTSVELSAADLNGIYIVKVSTAVETIAKKINVIK